MLEELLEYRHWTYSGEKVNYIKVPVNHFNIDDEGAAAFNKVYLYLYELWGEGHQLKRTPSGGISVAKSARRCGWDCRTSHSGVEITAYTVYRCWRFQFSSKAKLQDEETLYGRQAFSIFKGLCKKYNVNLDNYAVDNGLEVKKEIEKQMVDCGDCFIDKTLNKVHHIDFHNSWPAGLAFTHPEFKPVIEELYEYRRINKNSTDPKVQAKRERYKAILNLTIGFMQSRHIDFRYATLSRDAINDNNRRLRLLQEQLESTGRTVIAHNTDGIWYRGDIYHGPGEGDKLGEWSNDHSDCIIRFKSPGCYEYIEDGKYHPVVRGSTSLEKVKSRDQWEWGDIYNKASEIISYTFTKGKGVARDG